MEPHYGIFRVRVLALFALRKLWRLAPLTHGDVIALLSDSLPLLVILKQRFSKFIHKAMNHNSPIINRVAKLSIANPLSNCSANYRHILNECDTMYDVFVHDIGRVCGRLVCLT